MERDHATRRRRWAAAPVLVFALSASTARAADAPASSVAVRIDYRAPATCPSHAEFLDSVRRYTTRWTLASQGDVTHAFAIRLESSEAGAEGWLETATGPRTTVRTVAGPTCRAVARALAVMVALVIDRGAPASAPADAPTPEPSAPPAPVPSATGPSPPPPARAHAPSFTPPRLIRSPAHVPSRLHLSFELREEITYAVLRTPLFVLGAFADHELPLFHDSRTTSTLDPASVGVGVRQSFPRPISAPGGSTDFLWTAASLRFCPLRLRVAARQFSIATCAEGTAGVLRGDGRGLPFAQATTRRWFDAGASLSGVWRLGGPWFVTAFVGVVAPLTRYRFEVVELAPAATAPRPPQLVSQAPPLGMTTGIGLGLRL